MTRSRVRILFVTALACIASVALAQSMRTIRGDVAGLDGHTLHVKEATGQVVDVKLADDARVWVLSARSLDDVKPGTFVGATAKPAANGTLVASEVHIFTEAMRGTGEGHHPMRSKPGNTMTNATVSRVSSGASSNAGSMTNATVARVGDNAKGRLLHMTYKGGEQDIFVPADTPVVLLEPGTLALLTPGAHVRVNATTNPDGMLAATSVNVGSNGLVPPV